MKINATPSFRADPPIAKNRREATPAATDFQTILKQRLDPADLANPASPMTASFAPTPARPLALPETASALPLADRLDRLVDRLDVYRQKLADPHESLKSIQPVLNGIAAATEKLMPEVERLDDGEPLKDILKGALVTASLEIARFNRGDYI